ncbi:MAG: nickel pincer cofactor biosynthesis protein LarB [Acidimicrobiales bacterium]
MDRASLTSLLQDVARGEASPQEALERVVGLPYEELGYALVDHHRALRQGQAEVVYSPGKSPEQCAGIVGRLLAASSAPVIMTRATTSQREAALAANPGASVTATGETSLISWRPAPEAASRALVVTAGTADLPVAEECAATLQALGFARHLVADCGVAGLHRVLAAMDELRAAEVVVVVAGMEGALASVVGGIVEVPVIAVPTSVGYGSSFAGITALLAMLSSCAAGVTVVGIDNGFGAASAAARYLSGLERRRHTDGQ